MVDWQPIETAPKDGTRIFIFADGWSVAPIAKWGWVDGDEGPIGAWVFDDQFLSLGVDEGVLGWDEDVVDGIMPTHWAPLPNGVSGE